MTLNNTIPQTALSWDVQPAGTKQPWQAPRLRSLFYRDTASADLWTTTSETHYHGGPGNPGNSQSIGPS